MFFLAKIQGKKIGIFGVRFQTKVVNFEQMQNQVMHFLQEKGRIRNELK
jgi:hypothetical protein